MVRPAALYIMDDPELCYGPDEQRQIAEAVKLLAAPLTGAEAIDRPELLRAVEVLFTGWGAPVVDADFLAAAPNLKVIFYAAGSVAGWMTPEVWKRGIRVSSAYAANAVPVAEYTLA